MDNIAAAKMALDEALKAIDAGNTMAAKSEIEKAKATLDKMQRSAEKCMQMMSCANDKCPISGKAIDSMNRPQELTRMYKGMKIGFCCQACPPAWDKLSDEEKDAKLQAVCPMMMKKKGGEMMEKPKKTSPTKEY
jgi:hypothetical protein